jgi:acyl carrier protein
MGLDTVELVMAVEEEFGIALSPRRALSKTWAWTEA